MNVTSALGWILGSSSTCGAIDIVAVRQDDDTIRCSPFHVKFPAPVRNHPKEHKRISLRVNGEEVKVSMRLGSAGEAFFIVKNNEHSWENNGTDVCLQSHPEPQSELIEGRTSSNGTKDTRNVEHIIEKVVDFTPKQK